MVGITPGERIMIYRSRKDMTKKELALRAGTTVTTITNYEKGRVEFDYETITAIACALGVTVNRIQFGFDDPEKGKEIEGLIKRI